MADPIPVQKKVRRSFGPKVSTGCITCNRRVKCDELRPSCMRCQKYGTRCEGYKTTTLAPMAQKRHVARPILPNAKVLCKSPATVSKLFNTDQEFGYFQRFCIQNVRQLTGLRESEFWSRHVLQASEMEPCVRHAVIAIGTLDFSKRGLEAGEPQRVQRDRLEFAYREYGKAISCLKTTIAEKKLSIRTSLITSLLFACFEAYHGNSDAAAAQIQSSKPDIPTPPPIDHDIVDMFSLLEIQATSWGDKRSSTLHLQRMRDCEAAVGEIPREFKDIGQAQSSLFMISLRGIHLRLSQTNKDVVPSSEETTRAAVVTLGPLVGEPQHAELRSVLSMFKKWAAAYEPYLRRASSQGSSKERRDGAKMIYLHYLGIHLWVAAGASTLDSYYRRYTKELRKIVELGRIMSAENQDYFSLDIRFVLPLQVVALVYRHRALRQEVMAMYLGQPRREGMWDAVIITKVLEWISAIEEDGLTDEEYVPEDGIATLTAYKVDSENRSVYVQCVQGVRGGKGQATVKETIVYW
ncbi:hypothetical protein BKA61DRAFT_485552 [Leptodontidium sp. MPI-SDFR-AT-0119]|nr:hypothetical protein BKA61DRAFT_485552 [Leptodontidium sp. MPI-SDFR-AT-0119]